MGGKRGMRKKIGRGLGMYPRKFAVWRCICVVKFHILFPPLPCGGYGCQPLPRVSSTFVGSISTKKESYRILPQKFQDDLRFSLREALLVSLVLVDRRFFCIVFFWTSGTVDGNSMLPDEGARLDLQFFGFFSVYGVAIWRLKRSSPIFFSNLGWIKTNGQNFRPTCALDAGS